MSSMGSHVVVSGPQLVASFWATLELLVEFGYRAQTFKGYNLAGTWVKLLGPSRSHCYR